MLMLTDATEASVWRTVWDLAQQVVTFALALWGLWAAAVRPYMARKEAERKAEIAARDEARKDEVRRQVEAIVAPVREQVEEIHRTTHINGGNNKPPTLLDKVSNVGKQVETAIRAVGAVAVNQAQLSSDFQDHIDGSDRFVQAAREEFAKHGIVLPESPRPQLPPRRTDTDI